MGVVRVKHDEDCDVVVGAPPLDGKNTSPITGPEFAGQTNQPFFMADTVHCFSLQGTTRPFTPLWQTAQVKPGVVLNIEFKFTFT